MVMSNKIKIEARMQEENHYVRSRNKSTTVLKAFGIVKELIEKIQEERKNDKRRSMGFTYRI